MSDKSQSFDDMRSHLGKRVAVTLDYDSPEATQVGVLHRITDDGEVHVRDDSGVMHYCWPCLRVEALATCDGYEWRGEVPWKCRLPPGHKAPDGTFLGRPCKGNQQAITT